MNQDDLAHSSQHTETSTLSTIKLSTVANIIDTTDFFIGIGLALASSIFIGSSFILKKKGLIKLTSYHGSIRAASGGFGYLREFQWWAGLLTMGLGELCNFAAYGFAPASVVTPLGALSVLVSALMAVQFLDEKLTRLGKIGCFLTVSGSIVIIIHAPKESEVNRLAEFAHRVLAPEFLFFSLTTLIALFWLIFLHAPRYGSKQIHAYILICSLLGAFTVTSCKGLSIGLKELFNGRHSYSPIATLACALAIIVCVLVQMVYLNRALDIFPTPIVTTVYYVLFTTCVLISSGILFHEWQQLPFVDMLGCFVGFSITSCGLVLINYLKSNNTSNSFQCNSDNESLIPYFPPNSLPSSSVGSSPSTPNPGIKQKQQQIYHPQSKSYANLMMNDDDLSSSTNSINEHRPTTFLIDTRDLTS